MAKRLNLVSLLSFLSASRATKYLLVHVGNDDLAGKRSWGSCCGCHCISGDTLFELKFHSLSNADVSPNDSSVMLDGRGEVCSNRGLLKECLLKLAKAHTLSGSTAFFPKETSVFSERANIELFKTFQNELTEVLGTIIKFFTVMSSSHFFQSTFHIPFLFDPPNSLVRQEMQE